MDSKDEEWYQKSPPSPSPSVTTISLSPQMSPPMPLQIGVLSETQDGHHSRMNLEVWSSEAGLEAPDDTREQPHPVRTSCHGDEAFQKLSMVYIEEGYLYVHIRDSGLKNACKEVIPSNLLNLMANLQGASLDGASMSSDSQQSWIDTRDELAGLLLEEIRLLAPYEAEIRKNWSLDGPGLHAQELIALWLGYLQCQPTKVRVDEEGKIRPDGELRESSRHRFETGRIGVTFDFSYSVHASAILFVSWNGFQPLEKLGIVFDQEHLPSDVLRDWFQGSSEG